MIEDTFYTQMILTKSQVNHLEKNNKLTDFITEQTLGQLLHSEEFEERLKITKVENILGETIDSTGYQTEIAILPVDEYKRLKEIEKHYTIYLCR